MPREIRTTLAVDGEQAFKRAINEANTSMKNLGTQLTLASAQFKKDGDAMKLMETRSKALNGQIGQQEEIVKALEKAVEDSTKAYGENSEKTETWEAELNRAKAKLVNLQNELTLNEQGLNRSGVAFDEGAQHAADYQATLQTIGKNVSFKTVTDGISGITGKVESAIKKVISLGSALRDAFAEAGEWADELNTQSIMYNMDPEELQRWRYAAEFIDTDVESIIKSRDKLTQKMTKGWSQGSGNEKIDIWEMLGIDVKDENGYRNQMDVMFELGETLMNMAKIDGNDVRANEYAMEAFGKGYKELLPLFTAGRKEWEKLKAEAPVVSNEQVAVMNEMNDSFDELQSNLDVTKYSFLAEMAPTVTEITNTLTEMLKAFNEWKETDEGKQAMEDLSKAIQELFSGLKDVKFKDAIDKVKTAIEGVKDALLWLSEKKEDIYSALKYIAGGFALLKVSDTVLKFLQLKNGIQGLLGGGSGAGAASGGAAAAGAGGSGTAGVAAGSGFWASVKSVFAANGLSALVPAAVLSASVAQAAIAQKANEAKWISEYEQTEATAARAESGGKDATLLRRLNAATGPKVGADGTYQRGFLGFLDMNPTEQADLILQSLGDVKYRGLLYSDIQKYGPTNGAGDRATSSGNYAWEELLRYWGIGDGETLDPQRIDSLLEYLQEMETNKLEYEQKMSDTGSLVSDAVAEMKINTESTSKAADTVSGMDLKRFNQVPGNVESSTERGVRRGISGLNINIDGRAAGKILAPYISAEQANTAQ